MKKLILAATMLALPALSHAAVFTDNFDADVMDYNQTIFVNGWVAASGTVDVIGAGLPSNQGTPFFNFIPGNGHFIDLDGSSNDSAAFSNEVTLAGSTQYILSFDLAGNHRVNTTELVDVTFGTNPAQTFTLNQNDSFTTYTMAFTPTAAGDYQILFQNAGGDNIGALLDNVSVTAVPEPETYMMMLGGLGLIGFAARRRKA